MGLLDKHAGLYTDFYEFTMAQAFFLSGRAKTPACFDYFFRENPFDGGYVVFAGLDDFLKLLEVFRFDDDDIRFLKGRGLDPKFLEYLRDFRFSGTIRAAREGDVVFPLEPVARVEGPIVETQLIETILLNVLNFESLIATKAARIRNVAGDRRIVDFGLRRAQGFGGIQASRAAIIGGFDATSNVYAALEYDLTVTGTQAHSWIQSFDDELAAFRQFTALFPDNCILLVDTYNTLQSGVPNAITVAKEMEARGQKLGGIRLDSGDLAYLSKRARAMLDNAGLGYVRIVVSNQLDEYVIRSLLEQRAPIDAFGVGTRLVTGQPSAALDGVYKLSAYDGKPRLKYSENSAKITLPGVKKVLRFTGPEGYYYADAIMLEEEHEAGGIVHPLFPERRSSVKDRKAEPLLHRVMERGVRTSGTTITDAALLARTQLAKFSPEHQRLENPHVYKVGISQKLMELRTNLVNEIHGTFPGGVTV